MFKILNAINKFDLGMSVDTLCRTIFIMSLWLPHIIKSNWINVARR